MVVAGVPVVDGTFGNTQQPDVVGVTSGNAFDTLPNTDKTS
jgi:hypothetical protein